MSKLPSPPAGQQRIVFEDGRVAFLARADFSMHREEDETRVVYPRGESGITFRFSLHTRPFQREMPADLAERFVMDHASHKP